MVLLNVLAIINSAHIICILCVVTCKYSVKNKMSHWTHFYMAEQYVNAEYTTRLILRIVT